MTPKPKSYDQDREAKASQTTYTASNGAPIPHPYASLRAGNQGLLLQDFHLIEYASSL